MSPSQRTERSLTLRGTRYPPSPAPSFVRGNELLIVPNDGLDGRVRNQRIQRFPQNRVNLSIERPAHEETAGLIEEACHLRGNTAKARSRANGDCVVVDKIVDAGDRRRLVELEVARLGDLYVEALGAVAQLVHSGVAHIGIREPRHGNLPGFERIKVGGVELMPVAAPSHPLALCSANAPGAARNHTQLVLTDRSSLTERATILV